MTITVISQDWDKETNTFSFYASDKRIDYPPGVVFLKSSKTGKELRFSLTKIDKDGSGEDIYGWNYVSSNGMKLLIIND